MARASYVYCVFFMNRSYNEELVATFTVKWEAQEWIEALPDGDLRRNIAVRRFRDNPPRGVPDVNVHQYDLKEFLNG